VSDAGDLENGFGMQIIQTTGGIAATNAFLIADETTGKAVVFDAPNSTLGPLLDQAQKLQLDVIGLWLTHGHFDHIADHAVVTARYPGAKVMIHKLDEPKLLNPHSGPFVLPFVIQPRKADEYVEDHQQLSLGTIKVQVLHTPGHSPGLVVYYLPVEGVLVGGDLIIGGSIGRTDLPDSDPEAMLTSVQRVMKLPPETKLLPGHGRISTLGEEAARNPYVKQILRS